MPYMPHNRLTVSGKFTDQGGAGPEIWSFSIGDKSGMTPHDLVLAVSTAVQDLFAGGITARGFTPNVIMNLIRAEAIDAAGKVTNSYGQDVNVPGTYSTPTELPYFCCAAVTLETNGIEPSGRAIRGRFYPPNIGLASHGNGIGTGFGLTVAKTFASWITELTTAGMMPCVASAKAGLNPDVTAVSVDDVLDTQRRRRNSAKGQRGTQSLPFTQ